MQIYSHKLANGLTVLVAPKKDIPKASIQLWYNVGSKDEQTNEKGIAHLIEHMIFKGTAQLSECDINLITHKLSGYCNAYTSYDYTGYLFDLPSQHWHEALPIMADCMTNASFKEEFLNSELKAVIQELKMYKDNYTSSLIEALLGAIFSDHPYHYPIIGYKQDLWNLTRENLVNFYKKHYIPNNATLIVVGDVEKEEVFNYADRYFGAIKPNPNYKKEEFYFSPDLKSQSVTLYRDLKQPVILFSWVTPGLRNTSNYLVDIISLLIGSGKGSRLYKILVDELQLATDVESFSYDLFEQGLFFIYVKPKDIKNLDTIQTIIFAEINSLSEHGPQQHEMDRAVNKAQVEYLSELESNQKLAYAIGKYYLATGDKDYILSYLDYSQETLKEDVKNFIKNYLKPYLVNFGKVLPLENDQLTYWNELQVLSDKEDARILEGRTRNAELEAGKCVLSVEAQPPRSFNYPKASVLTLTNGLTVLYNQNNQLPKIDLILDFKVKHYYDPQGLEGLCNFVADMMTEGTVHYTSQEFTEKLESLGISFYSEPGKIIMSMLSKDLPLGLELLNEVLTHATFDDKTIQKVKEQVFSDIQSFWDSPSKFSTQLAEEVIYKNHPYSKDLFGTAESIARITKKDLIDFYEYYSNPYGARLALVGDLKDYNILELLEEKLGSWQSKDIPKLDYPAIDPVKEQVINYPINRDQVVLCFAGVSVSRFSSDFDKLLLFDQIFTGGVLSSMSSRLFDLRERSGLFYTIGGSLLYKVDKQPGLIIVKTIVSTDRLAEAESAIKDVINTAADSITDTELEESLRAITNSFVDNFASNYRTAESFLFLDKYNLPENYFDQRAQVLAEITKEEIQQAAKKYLDTSKMIVVKAGRLAA